MKVGSVFGILMVLATTVSWAAFDSHTLVLVQGVVPTIDGTNVGALNYTNCVDTYIDRANPDTSYYAADVVRFALWSNAATAGTRGYVRFENFETWLPAGSTIVGARLVIKSAGPDGGTHYASDMAYRTASFGNSFTWNTAEASHSANCVYLCQGGGWTATWALDNVQTAKVTAIVRQWHTNGLANHGFQFTANEENASWQGVGKQFYSSEHATVANRPRLEIDFVPTDMIRVGTKNYRRSVVLLNGSSVIEDTYVDIANQAVNYQAAAQVNYASWWTSAPLKRGLTRIKMTHPILASLAHTGDPLSSAHPVLHEARLEFYTTSDPSFYIDIMEMTQSWDVATATALTYDGATAWPESGTMVGAFPTNVKRPKISTDTSANHFPGSSLSPSVTTIIQAYVDGAVNRGLFVGQDAQDTSFLGASGLTEHATPWYRPTLVMELWTPYISGTVVLIQ